MVQEISRNTNTGNNKEHPKTIIFLRREIKREQKAWASSSSHPHVVTLLAYFKTNTSFCFVSDYVDGQDITNYLQCNGPFRETQAKIIASQVASAIMFIHNKGIIHRDINSNSIMLDNTKGAQLINFGLCTFERNPNEFCGALFYLCPEILEGKPYGTTSPKTLRRMEKGNEKIYRIQCCDHCNLIRNISWS
ncbi:putative protein kinase C delta type homolog [Centruroides sculpturatus]|uniref:putative protein kinase C delta type homolog n=1 Tax=Centruroides sculpturatus TaxID=218467 RepID=UPI000C6EA0AE|nr:putative protein kinase C delta type homolog [Centruroides sculpturatus]